MGEPGNGGLPQQGRVNVEGLALEGNIGLRPWLVLGLMARGKAEQCAQPVFGGQGCPEPPDLDALLRRIGILAEQVTDDVPESGTALGGIASAGAVRILPKGDVRVRNRGGMEEPGPTGNRPPQ